MKHQENFRELIELLLSNRISPEQKKKLSEWIDQPEYSEDLYALIKDSYYLHADDSEDSMENALEFLSGLKQKMAALPPATIKKTGYWRPFTLWAHFRSSIHFQTVFQGASREVDITGQVYFEIARNPRQPFIIKAKDQQVQVLGTAVNINAFDSAGGVTTTLAEGAVNVLEAGS